MRPVVLVLPDVSPEVVAPVVLDVPRPDVPSLGDPGLELPNVVLPVALPLVALPVHGLKEDTPKFGIVINEPDARSVFCGVTLRGAAVIIGLTPALVTSVDPSGTVPPARDDPDVALGVNKGEAVPVDDTVADDAEQSLEANPPPSNMDPDNAADWVG